MYTQGPKLWTLAQNILQHTNTHTHTNNIYTIQSILKVNNNNITIIQRKFGLLFGCIAGLLMYINTLIAAFLYTVLGTYCVIYLYMCYILLIQHIQTSIVRYALVCIITVLIVHTPKYMSYTYTIIPTYTVYTMYYVLYTIPDRPGHTCYR